MTNKIFLLLLLMPFIWIKTQAQVGKWTSYQSYNSATKLTDTGSMVYCVGGGGLFTYNKTDNSVQKLGGTDDLSDVSIETLAYGSENDVVLIAYENSNIDLIFDNEIYNLSDIKRKQILGNKIINSVMFDGNLAYLACGFGIVVINTEKKEVKDTWYIADNGGYVDVYDIASDGTDFYAATAEGVYYASVSEPNLQDYSNWHRFEDIPNAEGSFTQVENLNGKIVVCYSPETGNDELYMRENGSWSQVFTEITKVYDMTVAFNDRIIISENGDVYIFGEDKSLIEKIYQYNFGDTQTQGIDPRCTILNSDGTYWIADNKYGLVKRKGETSERLSPEGPVDNNVFSLTVSDNNLWVSSGGHDASWGNSWLQSQFQQKDANGNWSVYNSTTYSEMENTHDIISVTADPSDPDHIFAASWGDGIFEFKGDELIKHHSLNNSTLQSAISGSEHYVRVGGMAFGSDGTLWVTNGGGSKVLSAYKNGDWSSYSIPALATKYNLGNLVVTDDGDKWIIVPRSQDLYVVKGNNETRKWQSNIAYFSNGTDATYLPMHDIYSIAIDRDGAIWVGASGGVAVYSDPSSVWDHTDENPLYAEQPGLNMNDGIYHPLLSSETVTAIAVDGANQKWCGTKADGVFLISEDGKEELEHFTTENSSLLSDEITSIAINNNTGEVFIGTSEGLISYMGVATEPDDVFTDVYVYPNPVRETYTGPVIVTGLVEDTDVKITDISGNLVFHGTSLGGQISWDGNNLNGKRCHTGVYLVFLNNKTGKDTFVTKLLFIH